MNEEEPRLRIISFAAHCARGVIRQRATRRWTMFITLLIAMLLVFAGTTFLKPILAPQEHPGWFIVFWLACGWFTMTAIFLAFFDLLLIRAESRSARRHLQTRVGKQP